MPLLKIVSSRALRVDTQRLHSRVMDIFKAPHGAVQIVVHADTPMYPEGTFVDMRGRAKPDRDAAWMKSALAELTEAVKDAGAGDDVRIRCELFDDTYLHKNA
eukprot:TRINITY_DN20232_c0_g1_i1.p3 TRINITY_DN20232_c0_g1~~TRINITY_DN20232_c0_g1_i1.p3  ORF type:complete len:103 (+),score=30.71 TRINITY_DN20232_c0_g1_i1:42-350(+)